MTDSHLSSVVAAITIACVSYPVSALGQSREVKLTPELIKISRENLNDTTKRICLKRFEDLGAVRILAPFATVSEMCGCVISEVKFALSDKQAFELLRAQLDQSGYQKTSKAQVAKAFSEFTSRYDVALQGCGEALIRRRR